MKQTNRFLGTLAVAGTSLLLLISFSNTVQAEEMTPPSLAPAQSAPAKVLPATTARVHTNYGKLPLHFEPNRGQTASKVKFLSRGSGYTLFLTPAEAVLALRTPQENEEKTEAPSRDKFRGSKIHE